MYLFRSVPEYSDTLMNIDYGCMARLIPEHPFPYGLPCNLQINEESDRPTMSNVLEFERVPKDAFMIWAEKEKGLNLADAYAGWCAGISWYLENATNNSEDGNA